MKLEAIDLFCGAGGLTHGLELAGIEVKAGVDNDLNSKYAYEKNNRAKFVGMDIRNVTKKDLATYYTPGALKILVGCAPCQTFSTHTHKIKDREKDEKWNLLEEYSRLVTELMPDVVSMENVSGLQKYGVFDEFVAVLNALGYNVTWKTLFTPAFGVPQNRYRLVLLASRLGKIKMPEPLYDADDYPTVRDFIGYDHMHTLDSTDVLQRSHNLSETNMKRIKQSVPGGSWRDWDDDLILECHRRESGKTYTAIYGRMEWGKPSPTITTQFFNYGSGRFGHPEENRALSLREGALLQTFPPTYKFVPENENPTFTIVGRLIGNAVPVKLGEVIGQAIIKHIEGLKDA